MGKVSKSDLLRTLDLLSEKKNKLITQTKELKVKHRELRDELQPQIDYLKKQANDLAQEFKDLFRSSQEAYTEKDGASAKALSIEGHQKKDKCEEVNSEVSLLIKQLKSSQNKIELCFEKVDELTTQIKDYKKKICAVRQTFVGTFDLTNVFSNQAVEEFLDEFPEQVFKNIKEISYDENIFWESKTLKIKVFSRGMVIWDNKDKAIIKIGKQQGETCSKKAKEFKRTVAHEVGHVVYTLFLVDGQRAEWFMWHDQDLEREKFVTDEAMLDEEEDFAECFSFFNIEPKKLQNHDERRYNFIKDLTEKLNNEEA